MNKDVVLDIETQNTFQEVGAYDPSKLLISVMVCYFYETDEYVSYQEDNLKELWPRLEHCDRIIGYNSKGFDIPVMNNYYPGDLMDIPQLDMLEEIQKALGHRLKLDDVAAASIGTKKSGHGLQAVEWWKQGEIQKIIDYCRDDVKVTKELFEYGLKYKALAYEDRFGNRKGIPVDFSKKEHQNATINLTMGF